MEQRRWVNRYQPQTLVTATMLLYIEGVFNMARGVQALTVLGLLMISLFLCIIEGSKLTAVMTIGYSSTIMCNSSSPVVV